MDVHDLSRFLGRSGCQSHPPTHPKLCAGLLLQFVRMSFASDQNPGVLHHPRSPQRTFFTPLQCPAEPQTVDFIASRQQRGQEEYNG